MNSAIDGTLDGALDHLRADPTVTFARQFGWHVAMSGRRVFVVLTSRGPGVKLPAARRSALIAQHIVEPLADLQGRPLSEWVLIADPGPATALALIAESRAFVASAHARTTRHRRTTRRTA